MKMYTQNCFTEKQRIILETLALNEIDSEMDYKAAVAYFVAISMAKSKQLDELGGVWNVNDMFLLQVLGKRLQSYHGVADAVRGGIQAALYQVGEIHPSLAAVNPEFIE